MSKIDSNLLESLWSSNTPEGISQFFRNMHDQKEIFNFMKNRQKASVKLKILNEKYNPFLVFVIPTKDFQSPNALNIMEVLGNETVILVKSTGQFFNFSVSCNSGIQRARKLGPAWIIVCNDDTILDGKLLALKTELKLNESYDLILPGNSTKMSLIRLNILTNFLLMLANISELRLYELSTRMRFFVEKKSLGPMYASVTNDKLFQKILNRLSKKIVSDFEIMGYFIIARPKVFENAKFDETFINGGEDMEFMARLHLSHARIGKIGISIHQIGGNSFKKVLNDESRSLHDIANKSYLGFILSRENKFNVRNMDSESSI